jgi:hypothetical protein
MGDYLGRPDSKANPTVWEFNQVRDTGGSGRDQFAGAGAVCTWFGRPVRVAKLSNFTVGFAINRLGITGDVLNTFANQFGTANGASADDSWEFGRYVATNDLPSYWTDGALKARSVFYAAHEIEKDAKVRRLWPNNNPADNYAGGGQIGSDFSTRFCSPGFIYAKDSP